MSPGNILVIVIIVLSLVMLVAVGLLTMKRIQPTLKKLQETNETITQKKEIYTREADHINKRVDDLSQRVQSLQKDAEVKSVHFQDLMDESGKFQTSLTYLKDHAGEYSSGISSNLKDELKEDGPKLMETFKRAFKKTAMKQKVRYKK